MKLFLFFAVILIPLAGFSQTRPTKEEIEKEILIEAKKDPLYIKTFVAVHEIKNMAELRKKGLIRDSDIVKKYNERLSGYMGKKKTFNEVTQTMKNSDELLKMIQFKIASRIALERASQR